MAYENSVCLPRQDLTQQRHTKLYNAIPHFTTGLPHLYYSLTTFQNNHILPQHDEKTAADQNGRRLFIIMLHAIWKQSDFTIAIFVWPLE